MGLDIFENVKLDSGRYNNEWSIQYFFGNVKELQNGFDREFVVWDVGVLEFRSVDFIMINFLF